MPEATAPDPREQDESLARFADDVLRGQTQPIGMSSDPEVMALEKLVVRLNRAVGRAAPAPAMARRLRDRLSAEWHKSGPLASPEPAWRRGLRALLGSQTQFALAAVAVVVILVLALPLVWGGSGDLSGAAGEGSSLPPVPLLPALLGLAVLVAGLAWWWNRRK